MEARDSRQVVAEFTDCAFLMHQGEETFDFCLNDGACDYCQGAHELQVKWSSVVEPAAGRSFWSILDLDANYQAGAERYGSSGLNGLTK